MAMALDLGEQVVQRVLSASITTAGPAVRGPTLRRLPATVRDVLESRNQCLMVTVRREVRPAHTGALHRPEIVTRSRQQAGACGMLFQLWGAIIIGYCALADSPAVPAESTWREPGQIVEPAYRENGKLRYTAEGREIVGRNGTLFNNRPLYCETTSGEVVLAGDRPLVRLAGYGAFSAAVVREGKGRWFHEYADVESRYRCGRMTWRISDATLADVKVVLDVVPLKDASGFAVRWKGTGLRPGDRLVWAFGGIGPGGRDYWDPIMRGNPDICKTGDPCKPQLKLGMVPEWSNGNRGSIEGTTFRLLANEPATTGAVGRCDRPAEAVGGCLRLSPSRRSCHARSPTSSH